MSFILRAVLSERVNGMKLMWCFDSKNENNMTKQREMKCKKANSYSLYIFQWKLESQKRSNLFIFLNFFQKQSYAMHSRLTA